MTTDELLQLFTGEKAYRQLAAEIRPGRSVGLASLAGSSLSLVAAAAVRQTGGLHVFVMEDRDAAGYLYNDLFPLLGEERLLFFPTGYKRSIQFGQEDPSGIVQRTAALNAGKNNDGGALALDTPGFSSFEMPAVKAEELQDYFIEFAPYIGDCKFRGCAHISEPGCAVLEAVAQGKVSKLRHNSYKELYQELKKVKEWET